MRVNLAMYEDIEEAVRDIWGRDVSVKKRQSLSGGDINDAYRLVLSNGEDAFLKLNRNAPKDFFTAEANGLKAMSETGSNVPNVLVYGNTADNTKFLILSYEEKCNRSSDYWESLGRMLAKMHRTNTKGFTQNGLYGFYENNFIGATRQVNTPNSVWIDFFRDERLGFQMKLANHYFDKDDRRLCRRLLDRLPDLLIEPVFPSLLHGDLWSGNVMPDSHGKPMPIDPAVYVGHHEADIAMTELFGGFAPAFYDAYYEIIPRESEYADRRDIYNLYHLLNHLNLFGGSYLSSVRRILQRYAG